MLGQTHSVAESPLERELRARLAGTKPLAFLKIDMIGFRTYIEEYGYEKGDAVITMLGRVIQECLDTTLPAENFVAHLGWDEFGVITAPERAERLAQAIIARFDASIAEYYNAEARTQGFVDRVDRRGNPYRAPLMGVAIAIVSNENRALMHPLQITQIASEVRGYLRYTPNSRYAFDRRQK
ncbi:MAG: diguanylate cyclase [Chloroflexi bacterium]|nr:diguanylate cyclase [Chloroflexota bacterium]